MRYEGRQTQSGSFGLFCLPPLADDDDIAMPAAVEPSGPSRHNGATRSRLSMAGDERCRIDCRRFLSRSQCHSMSLEVSWTPAPDFSAALDGQSSWSRTGQPKLVTPHETLKSGLHAETRPKYE